MILNTEIFEIGKVSRCFGCASDETFDSLDAADQFRQTTVRSFAFFGFVTIVKTLLEFFLHTYYFTDVNTSEEANLIFPALDIFEVLLTIYALYCTFMFCSCLQQGLIYEYQPIIKFMLISLLAIMVICQDIVIYCFLSMFPPHGVQLSTTDMTQLSVQISSFFISIEAVFLLIFVTRHFQIRTETDHEIDINEEEYDELILNTL